MKEENLNILSFSENDQKVSAPVDDSDTSNTSNETARSVNFRPIMSICRELDGIEEELNAIFSTIMSIDKRLRALEKAKDTQTD